MAIYKCSKCLHRKVCIDSANYKSAENCRQYVPEKDVQEVVRCKGCKFGHINHKSEADGLYGYYYCSIFNISMFLANDYCSYGARMDGDTND